MYTILDSVVYNLRTNGVKVTAIKSVKAITGMTKRERSGISYGKWRRLYMPSKAELEEQRITRYPYEPLFSILIPLYESKEVYLKALIKSLQDQTYPKFEIVFSDGSPDKKRLAEFLKEYMDKDPRIRLINDTPGPLGIADNTNQAMKHAKGDFLVLGDHDDRFEPNALFECVKMLNEKGYADVLYSDEDKIDSSGRKFFMPHFKPDFNIDLLRGTNYICHMFVFSKRLADKVGGFRHDYDGSQDYDLILRCVENSEKVYHIPKILYNWRMHKESTAENPESKLYAFEAGKRAIEAHFERMGIKAKVKESEVHGYYRVRYALKSRPVVSVIIPNKDHLKDLKRCLSSLMRSNYYDKLEIIVVENNSEEEETFKFYDRLKQKTDIKVITWEGEFNYSAINNFAVKNSTGEYILFLNNDTVMINRDCIEDMLGICERDDVGAVGARLYYPDKTIQHAGVIVGLGGIAGHAFQGLEDIPGTIYFNRSNLNAEYSAVTAACMMIKRSIFEEIGGFDEGFQVAFNDVDLCMKVNALHKFVVYDANARLFHAESKTRGLEDTNEKIDRFNSEVKRFKERWQKFLDEGDPYYNPNLTLEDRGYYLTVKKYANEYLEHV